MFSLHWLSTHAIVDSHAAHAHTATYVGNAYGALRCFTASETIHSALSALLAIHPKKKYTVV